MDDDGHGRLPVGDGWTLHVTRWRQTRRARVTVTAVDAPEPDDGSVPIGFWHATLAELYALRTGAGGFIPVSAEGKARARQKLDEAAERTSSDTWANLRQQLGLPTRTAR